MKWEPVEARHGVNAQADAPRGYAAATFSGRYSQFTAMPDSAPVTPNHACGRRKQGSPLVIKAKAPATCSAGVTPGSPGTYSAALAQPAEHCPSKSDVAGSSPASRSTSTFQGLPPNARERRKSLSGLRIFTQYRSTDIQRNPLTAGSNWYVEWYIGNAEVPKTVLLLEEPGFRREHGIQLVSQELGSCFQTSRFDRPR